MKFCRKERFVIPFRYRIFARRCHGGVVMPAALPVPLREQMVRLHEEGHLLVDIAQQLNVRYSTLCSWWRRYGKEGRAGLKPHYERCGRHGPRDPQVQAAALAWKREHPPWGAGRIRVELRAQF